MFRILLIAHLLIICVSCNQSQEVQKDKNKTETTKKYSRFRGSYKMFNDMPDLHMEAAQKNGILPMETRADTSLHLKTGKLIRLPQELDMYKIDKLDYSIPFVVGDAAKLLVQIGLNFKDSLRSNKLPPYKLIITSVTRSQEDVKALTKRNFNASDNSVHCYGTTFDISWKRFQKEFPDNVKEINPAKLKHILGEVLHDLRERKKCYIVHERKQACFHITVR